MLVWTLLTALSAANEPSVLGGGDQIVLPAAAQARAIPAAAVNIGRIGALPAVRVDVLADRVLVGGNPAILLDEGQIVSSEGLFVRPLYNAVAGQMTVRLDQGASEPFTAVLALDGRVRVDTLDKIFHTLALAGFDQVAWLVADRSVTEGWTPTSRWPTTEDSGLHGLTITRQGFALSGLAPRDRALRGVGSLACSDCAAVDDLPWDKLAKIVARVAKADSAAPSLTLNVAEADLPAAVLVRAVDTLAPLDRPIRLAPSAIKPVGGGLTVEGEPVPVPFSGRLEVLSVGLPTNGDESVLSAIPIGEIERSFFAVRGRTDACLDLSRGQPGEIELRVEVAQDGTVQAATVAEDTFALSAVAPCLTRVVREMTFPAHTAEDPVVVRRTFRNEVE